MNVVKDRKRNKILVFLSFALSISLAVLIALKFKIGYSDATDITIRDIASGAYTGKPDAHLITVMYPFGLLLKALYSLASTIPWMDMFAVLFVFCAFFAIVWRTASIGETMFLKIVGMLLSASIILILYLKYVVSLKFFAISFLLAATAMLWAATVGTVKTEVSKADDAFVIVLFMTFSLMFDYRAFTMSVPLVIFATLFSFVRSEIEEMGNIKKRRKIGKRIVAWLIPVVICLGIIAGMFLWNLTSYSIDDRAMYFIFANSNPEETFKADFWEGMVSLGKALYAFTTSLSGLIAVMASMAAISVCFVKRDRVGAAASVLGVVYEFTLAGFLYMNGCLGEDTSLALTFYIVIYESGVLLRGFVRGLKKELASEFKSVDFEDIYSEKPEDRKITGVFWTIVLGIPCVVFLLLAGEYTYTSVCNENAAYVRRTDAWSEISGEFDKRSESIFLISESCSDMVTATLFSDAQSLQCKNFHFVKTVASDTELESNRIINLGVSDLIYAPAENNNVFLVCDSLEQASEYADFFVESGYGDIHLSNETLLCSNGVKTVLGRYLR